MSLNAKLIFNPAAGNPTESGSQLIELLRQLQDRGLDKNTIVIVTSDHGESLGQHGLNTHGRALYWELLRVPLVIWYPGHVPAGVRVHQPVTNAAIPATIMDMVEAGAPTAFPGPVLSQSWKSPGSESNWPIPLSEIARNPFPEDMEKIADATEPTSTTGAMKSLVTPQRHLIAHENLGNQVYDIVHDSGEQNNLVYGDGGQAELSALKSSQQTLLGKAWPDGRNQRMKSAVTIGNGIFTSGPDEKTARVQKDGAARRQDESSVRYPKVFRDPGCSPRARRRYPGLCRTSTP